MKEYDDMIKSAIADNVTSWTITPAEGAAEGGAVGKGKGKGKDIGEEEVEEEEEKEQVCWADLC